MSWCTDHHHGRHRQLQVEKVCSMMQSEQIQTAWILLSAAYFLQTGGTVLCRDVHYYNQNGGSYELNSLKHDKKQNYEMYILIVRIPDCQGQDSIILSCDSQPFFIKLKFMWSWSGLNFNNL
ncbi:hypothetical protein KY290_030969 [Solanum tuberosum]|uniref:Uncharacterized protein n=1 Tax=Solanum tuberosum TaxID=4113 RepID=A0ABQ7U7T7_SOLTU|nr:hypothetical protein KY290_030969 [Solanum tuberosum]